MLKKIVALATIVLMSTTTLVAAAESGQGRPTPEERLGRMQKHLDLSDDQVSQIQQIHDNGGGREEIGAVLTQDQRAKMGKHRGSEDHFKKMQEQLNLSEEQVSQIRDIRSNGGGREDVAKVLTEEQLSQLKELRKKNKNRRESGANSRAEKED
jgi:Spy/CpxP family protein refolding chaperone